MTSNLVKAKNWQELKCHLRKKLGLLSDAERTGMHWDTVHYDEQRIREGIHWWSVPGMIERWNTMISGDPTTDYFKYVSERYFAVRRPRTALTLGCGTGRREREWAKYYTFERHDAVDISSKSIEEAITHADQAGLSYLDYAVQDINDIVLPEDIYDVIFAEQSLHHVTALEWVLAEIKSSLRFGGFFVVHEYVGPSRFQWTDRQLEVINATLSILPERYRQSLTRPGTIKNKVNRPRIKDMVKGDPSEAVRSAEIPYLLRSSFEVIEWKEWGGTILHMLFDDIAGNFNAERTDDMAWVSLLCEIEDLLLSQGEISSDFVFAILS